MDEKKLKKLRERLVKLFRLFGSGNEHEAKIAKAKIDDLLAQHQMSWNAGLELIGVVEPAQQTASAVPDPDDDDEPPAAWGSGDITVLDCIHKVLGDYVDLTEHEYVAVSLWILHAHIYDKFIVSPRLTLTSPVWGCGKTTVLEFIEHLVPLAERVDNISAAAIYHAIDGQRCVLLLDEGDNLGMAFNAVMRSVLNSGHRQGGKISRIIKGEKKYYQTFAPTALAVIGALPLPLISRSIIIHMKRSDGTRKLRRFEKGGDVADLDAIYRGIFQWKKEGIKQLNMDPEIPTGLRNRQADNWRPLIAIADLFGAHWAKAARDAAIALSKHHLGEDVRVTLLHDIREVFNTRGVDRLTSKELAGGLNNDLEESGWSEWRGIRDNERPHRLTQAELASLLKPFQIRPRVIWPGHRAAGSKSARGYYRHQFEDAWASYCEGVTPSQPSNIKHLRRHGTGT